MYKIIQRIQGEILKEQATTVLFGKTISLPTPQKKGTFVQRESYAFIKAQHIVDNALKAIVNIKFVDEGETYTLQGPKDAEPSKYKGDPENMSNIIHAMAEVNKVFGGDTYFRLV